MDNKDKLIFGVFVLFTSGIWGKVIKFDEYTFTIKFDDGSINQFEYNDSHIVGSTELSIPKMKG